MRAIAIREPAASAIAYGTKKVERRTRRIAPGPLVIAAEGRALCIVDVVRVSGAPGAYAWHLARPRLVSPFPVRSFGWIVHVDDAAIRFVERVTRPARARSKARARPVVSSRSPAPYTFEIDDRKVRGESARTPAAARKRAAKLAAKHGRDVWILRDGIAITCEVP